jgi:hypothetical protein
MSQNIPITLQFGNLPPGYKPGTWPQFVQELEKLLSGYLPGNFKPVNYGSSTPDVNDQDRPWIRTNPDGTPDRTYIFFNGMWVARHPIEASSDYRALWVGSLASLLSFDGGDGTGAAPTATTGAMWAEDEDFRDRVPMGVKAGDGSVATVGATAGAKSQDIQIDADHLPRHRHEIGVEGAGATQSTGDMDDADALGRLRVGAGTEVSYQSALAPAGVGLTRLYGAETPELITVATLPPVRGVYVIKRTARQYYVAA